MALDKKLTSGMASNTSGPLETNGNVASSTRTTTSSFTGVADTPTLKEEHPSFSNIVSSVSEPAATENETMALLKSIEKQLKILNQSVADLEQEVGSRKDPDYGSVFHKIDSVRGSIERVIAGIGTTAPGATDKSVLDKITDLEVLINGIAEKQDRNDRQLAHALRENANFRIQVRQGMQHDIDAFKEQQSGEQFNPILKEIASMYVEYQSLLENENNLDLLRKNLKALFEQLEDLLIDYDAKISRSEIGAVRQTRSTKIIKKVLTGDREKHNTVFFSRKPGVIRGRTVLHPEFVDVFVFDPTVIVSSSEGEPSQQSDVESTNIVEEKAEDAILIIEASELDELGV